MNPNPTGSGENTDSGDLSDLSIELQSTLLNIGGQESNKFIIFFDKDCNRRFNFKETNKNGLTLKEEGLFINQFSEIRYWRYNAESRSVRYLRGKKYGEVFKKSSLLLIFKNWNTSWIDQSPLILA